MGRKPSKSGTSKSVVLDAEVVSSKKKKLKPKKAVTAMSDSFESVPDNSSSLVTSDPLVLYLNEIRKYPLLTKEEEEKLALKYHKTKDPLAAEKLVTSNLR